MASIIYKITNQVNDKVYIGQTRQSLSRRRSEHIHRLKANERQHKLYRAIRKHGLENFFWEEFITVLNDSYLDDLEMESIAEYNSFNRGYNSTPGGDTLSDATKLIISEKMKGRKITWSHKIVTSRKLNGNYPKKGFGGFGADHKASKKYQARTPKGDIVVFDGLRQFCRDNGLSHNLLLSTLSGEQSHHKGYILLKRFND